MIVTIAIALVTALDDPMGGPDGGALDPRDVQMQQLEERLRRVEAELGARDGGPAPSVADAPAAAALTVGASIETYHQWNFNEPDNFITHFRGFDNRHNVFTIGNAVLDVAGRLGPVNAHLVLQWGATSETYYLAEPVWRATAGTGASGPDVWKFVQQANLGWVAPVGKGLLIEAGVFTSPIGPEGFAIKDQWAWSRSNLFFGLPFYHSGVRATLPVTDTLSVWVLGTNGWNNVVDNNSELSAAGGLTVAIPDRLTFSLLAFSGVERPPGAAEGRAWRHLIDSYVTWTVVPALAFNLQLDAGLEPNAFGTSGWAAGALSSRVRLAESVFVSARGDFFREWIAANALGRASPIFWAGARWVASGTATLEVRPADHLSLRLEVRHDQSDAPLFFGGRVPFDADGNWVPTSTTQNTLTVGATAWF